MTELVNLIHVDGALPNLALMRLGTWFGSQGARVRLLRQFSDCRPMDALFAGDIRERSFGSSVFTFSKKTRDGWDRLLGPITWGGTGVSASSNLSEVAPIDWEQISPDYSLYPRFSASIGFLTRGCRLRCGFCVVPQKEGKPHAVSDVSSLWRGDPHPRHLHLLDNDAFAPKLRGFWNDAIREIRDGDFRICFSQGINLRLIDEEAAAAIASIRYTGHDFARRRLFTAWDNLGDEKMFRRGVAALAAAGVPPSHLRVYMLVGYESRETWESIFYRFNELVALGCEPYPMVYDRSRGDLKAFQRWAVRHLYRKLPFPEYGGAGHGDVRISAGVRQDIKSAWSTVVAGWRPERKLAVVGGAA